MPLIKCPACDWTVSDQALSCPSCAHPLHLASAQSRSKHVINTPWAIALGVIFVIVVAFSLAFGGRSQSSAIAPPSSSPFCEDALARRRNAEQSIALAKDASGQIQARQQRDRADSDVSQLCK